MVTYIISKGKPLPIHFGGIYFLIYPPIWEEVTSHFPILEDMVTSTHLFRRTSTHLFRRACHLFTYLRKDGHLSFLSTYLWKDGHLSTYLGKMATYPSTLEEFIYLSIYLLTYLRGNGHPPDYVGGNATCTNLCRRE